MAWTLRDGFDRLPTPNTRVCARPISAAEPGMRMRLETDLKEYEGVKRTAFYPAAALVAFAILLPERPAWGWNWNPFARSSGTSAKPTDDETSKAQAAARKAENADQASQLNKVAKQAGKADRAKVKQSQSANNDRPKYAPAATRYRWSAAKQPNAAQRAVSKTVNAVTLKPLRDKLNGKSTTSRNPWSQNPPVASTSAKQRPGMFSSLFKPKPKPKTGPRTVSEWITQDRPTF